MMRFHKLCCAALCTLLCWLYLPTATHACTGVRLVAKDGSAVYGRTMEWGTFDLHSRVTIFPRGYQFTGLTPDGYNGKTWQAKYGFLGLDMLQRDILADGMNEKGLAVGLFYHPGYARYMKYDKVRAKDTITAVDIVPYILAQFATVAEAKKGMQGVIVVPVVEKSLGIPMQAHWMVTEPSGKSMVIEYLNGRLRIFDNPLGVITNAPAYDWHMTNLRNYVNLSAVAIPTKKIENLNFAPLGGGSGMIGLPGDFTPPSRFIRLVAWSQTKRPLPDSNEAVYELFRILDNFNVPLGAAEGSDNQAANLKGMRSSTTWTTGWDLHNKVLYFHTQHNRRVRMVALDKLDLTGDKIKHIVFDQKMAQDIEDISAGAK